MKFSKKLIVIMTLATSFSVTAVPGNAQSFLEKSFVAKSKLNSKTWTKHDPNSAIQVDHGAWDAFLAKYVKKDGRGINRVAYGSVNGTDKAALKTYLKSLQSVDVTKLNRNEQYAFWLNLYNASTVNIGVSNFPIDSILDVKTSALDLKGPFNDKVARINGKTLTLDDIESGVVRPIWNDPRLHYAFNCAAVSCPNLGSKAYQGATINAQLDAAARSYINDPRGVRVNGNGITASKIYFWYSEDFGRSEADVLKHIGRYANASLKAKLAGKSDIQNYEYDWALNSR